MNVPNERFTKRLQNKKNLKKWHVIKGIGIRVYNSNIIMTKSILKYFEYCLQRVSEDKLNLNRTQIIHVSQKIFQRYVGSAQR